MKTLIKVLKFLLKNWIPIAFAVLIVVLFADKSCDESAFKKDIKDLDNEVIELNKKNFKLYGEANDYVAGAVLDKRIIDGLKAEIVESESRITELEKEEAEVEAVVAGLTVLQLVEDTKMILECAQVELADNGILFSVKCTRSNLSKLKKFSLVEGKYDEAILALTTAKKALLYSDRRSLKLFGALWKFTDMIVNYKSIIKKKDAKYTRSEKQRRRSYFKGIFLGFVIGGGITITIVLVIPLIRWLF